MRQTCGRQRLAIFTTDALGAESVCQRNHEDQNVGMLTPRMLRDSKSLVSSWRRVTLKGFSWSLMSRDVECGVWSVEIELSCYSMADRVCVK